MKTSHRLDEGDLLYMPTALPGISAGKAAQLLQQTDRLIKTVPEVASVYGKAGRAETATDPAPMEMFETTIQFKPREQWRAGMTQDKLVEELDRIVKVPGLANIWVPPIRNGIDMLATGIKSPVGVKVAGTDLAEIDRITTQIEKVLKDVPGVSSALAERLTGGRYVDEAANMSSNGFRTVVDIDLVGTWNTFRASLALLREGRSNLLAISAVQSVMPMATQAHVCAAKAGIDMLVRTLSIEWAQRGVRCNAIAPGPVADTEGMRRLAPEGDASWARVLAGIPMARAADLDEIADLALFLCSGAARYIHGTVITIDGGQTNLGSLPFGNALLESLKPYPS